ncbi:MAG: hypothetical protein J6K98_00695 [Clostridia bacterium]|nr:hypothetical protein [Clostridia bacterium]
MAATLPPVILNGVVVGLELAIVYFDFTWLTYLICGSEVAAGELIAATFGGLLLWKLLPKRLFEN